MGYVRVWKLEFQGYGVEPFDFASQQDAKDFAAACFYRGGRKFRIYSAVKKGA